MYPVHTRYSRLGWEGRLLGVSQDHSGLSACRGEFVGVFSHNILEVWQHFTVCLANLVSNSHSLLTSDLYPSCNHCNHNKLIKRVWMVWPLTAPFLRPVTKTLQDVFMTHRTKICNTRLIFFNDQLYFFILFYIGVDFLVNFFRIVVS